MKPELSVTSRLIRLQGDVDLVSHLEKNQNVGQGEESSEHRHLQSHHVVHLPCLEQRSRVVRSIQEGQEEGEEASRRHLGVCRVPLVKDPVLRDLVSGHLGNLRREKPILSSGSGSMHERPRR